MIEVLAELEGSIGSVGYGIATIGPGIGVGLVAAGCLPSLPHACGLGTGGLFVDDVVEAVAPVDGELPAAAVTPDPARVAALAAAPERVRWWVDRIRACWPLLS